MGVSPGLAGQWRGRIEGRPAGSPIVGSETAACEEAVCGVALQSAKCGRKKGAVRHWLRSELELGFVS